MSKFDEALKPGSIYVFVFGHGINAIVGKFDGRDDSGALRVVERGSDGKVYYVNPDNVIYVRAAD